jgi:putative redox protein
MDSGPMGGELFLAGIGGCFMSTLLAAAAARDIPADGVACRVEGRFADAPRRFSSICLVVEHPGGVSDELARVVKIAERGCIVLNTLRGSIGSHLIVSVC